MVPDPAPDPAVAVAAVDAAIAAHTDPEVSTETPPPPLETPSERRNRRDRERRAAKARGEVFTPRPRGRPRKPRDADGHILHDFPAHDVPAPGPEAIRPLASGEIRNVGDLDHAKRADKAEREVARLRDDNANLIARLDPQIHTLVKSSLAGVTLMVGKFAARRYGDHMLVTADEARDVGEHCGNALIPFLGDMAKYAPLVLALGSVAAIAIPRMEAEEAIRQGKAPRLRDGLPFVIPTPAAATATAAE